MKSATKRAGGNDGMALGTAVWQDGYMERRTLVARLPGDPSRVVDLNRVERVRLAQLGEGRPEAVADALVPPSLRLLLESGPLGLQRAAQTLLYAEKWRRKGGIPPELAPAAGSFVPLPCLPRPLSVRASDGHPMDRLCIQGPGAALPAFSMPTLALVGGAAGGLAGCCIAAASPRGLVLGAWLQVGPIPEGEIMVEIGSQRSTAPMNAWKDLVPPPLLPGEVFLLPAPKLRLPSSAPGTRVAVETAFDRLELTIGPDPVHHLLQ
jgi:hypothetical protein